MNNEKSKDDIISFIQNEKAELLISSLKSTFYNQKIIIEIINKLINSSNKENINLLEKLNNILPEIIIQLGIPFCELLNNAPNIINYYFNLYLNSNPHHKKILLNFIHIFNYESIEINPADDIIEKLELKDSEIYKIIKNQKRKILTEIENLYDEISSIISNIRFRINIEDNFDNETLNNYRNFLDEKSKKINEISAKNKYPKSTIEFFQDKLQNIISLFNQINKNKTKVNTFDKQNNKEFLIEENQIKNCSPNKDIKISIFNNLNISENNENEIMKNVRKIPLKDRTSFYKDEKLVEGEDEFTEFKNYYLPLNENQGNELKRQFCAFLNNKGGRLYLGINDQKIVKGVILNYKKCDSLRNLLVNYTYDFYPKCRLDKIKVYFIPIKNMSDDKFINNLFIVKIIVLQGEPNVLYSMTNKGFNSAIRLQGQCANLTAEEITKEIIKRQELKKLDNWNNQFNDPEPEKNYEFESDINGNDTIISDRNDTNIQNIIYYKKKEIKINKRDIIVVEVKNIDKNLDIKQIYDIFKDSDTIYQKFFSKDGKSRGYGLLKFGNEKSAIETIKKFDKLQVGNNQISLRI